MLTIRTPLKYIFALRLNTRNLFFHYAPHRSSCFTYGAGFPSSAAPCHHVSQDLHARRIAL